MLDLLDVPVYEPDLMAPDMTNAQNPRRALTVTWGIRPDRGDGWLGVSDTVVPDAGKAHTFTTWDRAERYITLYLPGGLRAWRVSQTPYALPQTYNPDLLPTDAA